MTIMKFKEIINYQNENTSHHFITKSAVGTSSAVLMEAAPVPLLVPKPGREIRKKHDAELSAQKAREAAWRQKMTNSTFVDPQQHQNKSANRQRQAADEIQNQYVAYATIFDFISRISTSSSKRDAIEKIKEIFVIVFGEHKFKYWNSEYGNYSLPDDINDLMLNTEQVYFLLKEENRFCMKINWHDNHFGAIDVSGFMFQDNIEEYLNLALEIVAIGGEVFFNNEQYKEALKSEQIMRYAGTHDALTDLYNRAYINEIIDQQIQDIPYTVFIFDIDDLKFVNDHYGHAEGDKLIISVALILKKCFRENDVLARLGGDEFVAILPEMGAEGAELFKNRIKQLIESHNSRQDDHLRISLSIGYEIGKMPEDTIEKVMKVADEQMYKDKKSKRSIHQNYYTRQ